MLALGVIAMITVGSVAAYNEITPRVRASSLLGSMQPALVDLSTFAVQTYMPRPYGLTGAAVETLSAPGGWGTGTPSNAVLPLTCGTAPLNTVGTCTSAPGCTWAGGACGGAFSGLNPNAIRVGNIPTLRLADGIYDLDADVEWHIDLGDGDGMDVAFALAPASDQPFGIGSDFARCGGFANQAIMFIVAVESDAVCENLWPGLDRLPRVSAAWCEADFAFPAGTSPDGEAAVLACFRSR